jgi:hypothetical protein
MEEQQVMEWWFKAVFTYGIGPVFTAAFLLGILWVAATLVRILTARLPAWFDDQAATNLEVRKGMQALVDHTETIHERTYSTQRGLRAGLAAAHALASKHDMGHDVVLLLDEASRHLRNGDNNNARP